VSYYYYLFITPRRRHRKTQTYKHTKHRKKRARYHIATSLRKLAHAD